MVANGIVGILCFGFVWVATPRSDQSLLLGTTPGKDMGVIWDSGNQIWLTKS